MTCIPITKQMGLETGMSDISQKSMEEIEIFKTAESPTGERIKLFVDELESLEPAGDGHTYEPPAQACWAHGNGLELVVDLEEGLE